MNPRKKRSGRKSAPKTPSVEENDSSVGAAAEGEAEVEVEVAAVVDAGEELQSQFDELQDRYLRIAAEYENFRKRTARERVEMWQRAQAEVVSNILDALDDFERVLQLDSASASAEDVIKGVELVERKLLRELESAGLERVGRVGEAFDPKHHEAIGSLPAETEEEDHTVGAILQSGYKFGGALIRPARVQVLMWQNEGSQGPG
ncbi:MAG: nucleotide exchange factor GrpE [Gemmatimonadetes bacterium]|nr:nucleotide exchange factor GrpE [Gemmatimonadota bacterium]MCH8937788.1 nucleotide exchange factor GrpE [Gemmatimonadota bacterium]